MRFFGVTNQMRLKHQLDQIKIGERKMYANLPRFKREEGKQAHSKMKRWKHGHDKGPIMIKARKGVTRTTTQN